MAIYTIIELGDPHTQSIAYAHKFENAKDHVDRLRKRTGKGYYINKVERVYEVEPLSEEEMENDDA